MVIIQTCREIWVESRVRLREHGDKVTPCLSVYIKKLYSNPKLNERIDIEVAKAIELCGIFVRNGLVLHSYG